jgi:hypothetical protein
MRTILVPLTGDPGDNAALETAYLVARLFEAHITGLHVSPGWGELAARSGLQEMGGVMPSAEVLAALQSGAVDPDDRRWYTLRQYQFLADVERTSTRPRSPRFNRSSRSVTTEMPANGMPSSGVFRFAQNGAMPSAIGTIFESSVTNATHSSMSAFVSVGRPIIK